MKLIIDIPEDVYTRLFDSGIQDNEIAVDDVCEIARALRIGTPLDDVKAEIQAMEMVETEVAREFYNMALDDVIEIIDDIGKADMRESIGKKIRCNTCKNNDDELSGECYECVKGIFDHYEAQESEDT